MTHTRIMRMGSGACLQTPLAIGLDTVLAFVTKQSVAEDFCTAYPHA